MPSARADLVRLVQGGGVEDVELSRGLHFNSADHALDAASEGAGVLLGMSIRSPATIRALAAYTVAAYSASGRAYHFVCPKRRADAPQVRAFRQWIKEEAAAVDWKLVRDLEDGRPMNGSSS